MSLSLPYMPGCLGGAEAAYITQGRDFDGTNDYATRGADLTGIADGKVGLFSFWVRLDGGDSGQMCFFANGANNVACGIYVGKTSLNLFQVRGADSSNTNKLSLLSASAYTAGASWLHVLCSFDLAAGSRHLYINGGSDLAAAPTVVNADLDLTRGNFSVGGETDAGGKTSSCLSELWFNTEYLDISVQANREKFRSAAGKPVNLGANGATPTGNQPLIYMPYGNPADNKGTGGNFTVTGTLDVSSTSPSD